MSQTLFHVWNTYLVSYFIMITSNILLKGALCKFFWSDYITNRKKTGCAYMCRAWHFEQSSPHINYVRLKTRNHEILSLPAIFIKRCLVKIFWLMISFFLHFTTTTAQQILIITCLEFHSLLDWLYPNQMFPQIN